MLISYNDDGGTHEGARILTLCGFLADGDLWEEFDKKWNAVLNQPGRPSRVNAFHSYDCVYQYGEFASWPYAECLVLFGDLVSVILQFDIRALGSGLVPSHMAALSVEDVDMLKAQKMGEPLELVFHLLMQQTIHRSYEFWPTEELGVVFENMDRGIEEKFRDLYIDYRDGFYLGDRLRRSPAFLNKECTPLQAADLLAYSSYRVALANYFPSESEPYFPVIPAFQRIMDNLHDLGGIYDSQAFARFLNRVKSKDPSIIGNKKSRKMNPKTEPNP